jgi:hypothetical protein
MQTLTLDDLARLDERAAVERHFDQQNDRVIRWVIPFSVVGALPMLAVFGDRGTFSQVVVAIAAVVAPLVMAFLRRFAVYDRNPRPVLISWVVAQYALFMLPFVGWHAAIAISCAFPVHFLALRYRKSQYVALSAVFSSAGIGAAIILHPNLTVSASASIILFTLWVNAALATAGVALSDHVASRFLRAWQQVVWRNSEEARMRSELAAARQIQLSMLPDAAPSLPWIDLAGASLPATEVGGDFFGYFKLDDDRIAIVVADVAGHGVASGIVLAGIKSGLHLLQGDLADPTQVMARLDRMVRESVRWRMLVTMLIAVVDRNGTVSVVSAGHPPLIHLSKDGFAECGDGALPLGTRLASRYTVVQRSWSDGDLLLCCTDGLLELQSPAGELYGSGRLERVLRDLDPAAPADVARHEILADLARFRADAAQEDDITVVVARLKGIGGSAPT